MEHIHTRLREELERLNLSMADAARDIGEESSQGIRDVCSGRKRASAELVAKLAVVGVDVLYILTGTHGAAPALKPDEAALLDNYRHCSGEVQQGIKAQAVAMSKSKGKMKKVG